MVKKAICLIFSFLFCFSFTACGATTSSESVLDDIGPETGTVTMVMGGGTTEVELYDQLIATFQEENPGIEVEPIWYNSVDAIYQDLLTGNAPDVISIDAQFFGAWAKQGAIRSIQPFIDLENYDLSDFWPGLVQIARFDKEKNKRNEGDIFGLPKDYGVNGIYVNTTIVNQAVKDNLITEAEKNMLLDRKNPLTFEQYAEIAAKLTVVEKTSGRTLQYGSNGIAVEAYCWTHGTDLIKDGKYFNAEDPIYIEAYELLARMSNPKDELYSAPTVEDSQSLDSMSVFQTGKIALYWGGRWDAPKFEEVPFEWQCIPLPVAEKGGDVSMYFGTVLYGISRNSKKTGMAWKLIKFLASQEAYRVMNQMNYAVPARKSLLEEAEFKDPTLLGSRMTAADAETFFLAARNAKIAPHYYFVSNRWIEIIQQNVTVVLSGEKTAAEFLKSIEGDVNLAIRASDPSLFE